MYAPSYENAKAQGADELQAGLTAFLNSFAGSIVEIGGGIQAIPTSEKGIAALVKNLADEGKEEVIQGIIEQLTNKAIHAPETPWFSLDDENAVINPKRAADEFLGGAFGAALIGGGNAAYRHIAENSFGGNLSAKGFAEKLAEKASKQTKQNTASDMGKPVTEIYTEKPAAVAVELDENGKEHNRPLTVSVKDGQLALTDEQGGSVELNENTYVDHEALGNAAVLADLAESYGMSDDAVNAMINTVPQTLSIAPEDYVRYYNRIYDTAAKGVEVDKVLSRTDGIQTVIGAEAANAAAYAGARQYRAQQSAYNADIEAQLANQQHNESGSVIDETKGAADLAVRKVADAVSGKTGYTIRLVDGSRSESGERGSFSSSKGEIVVDVSSGNAVSTVLHETAHYIELNAPEDFKAMADEIRSVLSSKEITTDSGTISMLQYAADNYARVYSERYGENVTAQQVMAEITADSAEALLYKDGFLESLLSDEHTVTELAKNDKSAFARFMDKVREIIATIKEYLNGKGRNNSISKVIEENAAALERIEKLYMQGLENAKKNYDSAARAETGEEAADNKKAAESSGSKYSIDRSFERNYNLWDRENLDISFRVGSTSEVLRSLGVDEKSIYWDASKISKIKNDHPEMTDDVIKQVPSILENPVLVMESLTVKGRLTLFGEVYGINGAPVLAVLELNPTNRNGHSLDIIKIASAYGKDTNPQRLINNSRILYVDKKRANDWLSHNRLQLPLAYSSIDSDNTIPHSDSDVKQKFSLSDPLNAAFNQDVQDKFEKDVDDVLNGKYTSDDPLMLGTTPTVFRQIGLSALPVVITKNHVYSIAATEAQAKADGKYSKKVNYHGLGAQTVKQIYSKISNPLAIIAAQDITVSPGVYSAHRVVAIVDLSINGKQVIAPVEVDADVVYQKDKLDVNLVATYYDKNNIASMLKNAVSSEQSGGVGFYYIDKKRAANLLKQTGVQFPSRLVANNSNGIIHQVDEKVNRKIDTVLKSQQFIRWFGDWQNSPETASKVVNEDGTPKVVYHGTNADFTVFDLSKSGQTAPGISDGFFFFTDKKSNYPNSASDYANSTSRKGGTPKVYEVYLSIKNPLYIDSKGYYDNIAYFDTHSDEIYSTYFSGDYDGVIISNSDKSADDSTLYLLDNASAIKSATDNIGTFDGSNPDIRYSLENTSSIDYPSLLKENTDLKKQNEALAAEMKLTEGHKVSRGAVEKLAGKILREYKSGYDKTVLADNLEKVFNYIADENADAAQAMDVLSSVAKAVIEQSSEVDYSLSEQFSKSLR